MMAKARTDALHQKPHRLTCYIEKALDPQHVKL
jgi:hypothetical protein